MPADPNQPDHHRLREAAATVVKTLRADGHEAYFAGGCVRDQIMSLTPSDYDVATDATPNVIRSLFSQARLVGEAFGVVMVCIDNCWIEVATFRAESGYTDKRRPDTLRFTNAAEDAKRRDFTINGLFYDPLTDKVIDYVDGRTDIERQTIRAIGDPELRLGEDYLRMLRAVRFTARLDFTLDPATAGAIRKHAHDLTAISKERIGLEVRFMLQHHNRAGAVSLLQSLTLDGPVLNESNITHPTSLLESLPADAAYPLTLTAWAIDRHASPTQHKTIDTFLQALDRMKPAKLVRRWRDALVLSNEDRDTLLATFRALPILLDWPNLSIAKRKRLMAEDHWRHLYIIMNSLATLLPELTIDIDWFNTQVSQLREEGVDPEPLLNGDHLIAAGLQPGPLFREVIDAVYDAQLEGRITTHQHALDMAMNEAASR